MNRPFMIQVRENLKGYRDQEKPMAGDFTLPTGHFWVKLFPRLTLSRADIAAVVVSVVMVRWLSGKELACVPSPSACLTFHSCQTIQ